MLASDPIVQKKAAYLNVPFLIARNVAGLALMFGMALYFVYLAVRPDMGLADKSEEDDADCLGLIPGVVRRLRNTPSLPHIGWNDLEIERPDPLFDATPREPVYFVHSYAPEPDDPSTVIASSDHGDRFVAAVRSGSVSGTQFHPERSGRVGLAILANVVKAASTVNA